MATSKDNAGIIVLPPVFYAAALCIQLVLHWFRPLPIFAADAAERWAGLPLIVLGFGIGTWGAFVLERAGTNVNPTLPSSIREEIKIIS